MILEVFKERGFFEQATHEEELTEEVAQGSIHAYTGFDPTADSLHVGHLIPIMGLSHLQRAGHHPIALMGGGTAMVGDPSGKTEMRKMLTLEQLEHNVACMKPQLQRFIDFSQGATLINNADWLASLNYIEFLRDIGRHFSVNRMLSFDTYQTRLETGLSFIEFNYQLLQAYDFLELYRRFGCVLQLGGSDQWANIVAGVDLVRRLEQRTVYGWTYPLLTTSSGKKMGKTEKGAVWLDANKTSPYEYYQYWVNIDDADVSKCLGFFTYLDMEEVREFSKLEGADIRKAKAKLAFEATCIAHGEEEALKAEKGAQSLFGGASQNMDHVPSTTIALKRLQEGIELFSIYEEVGLCKSKSEARRLFQQGGLYINNERVSDQNLMISEKHTDEQGILLRAGKKRYHRIEVS